MSRSYSIDTGDGQQLCAGLPASIARRTAQRIADERDEPVDLYSSSEDGDVIEPTEIAVILDGPNGPLVTYGAQNAERVEREIPDGWKVDWSSVVDLAPSGTHLIRYSAPLVRP